MSRSERPEPTALDELEHAAGAVAAELDSWRRRCLAAEAALEEIKARAASFVSGDIADARKRMTALESENRELVRRMHAAREQIEQLRTRLRFVNEQVPGERS